MKSEPVIVGNALSGMVAAKATADSGQQVVLVNGSKNWGGHFSTVTFGDYQFDAGMVLHEFTAFNSDAFNDLSTYNPKIRNDAGRFCNKVKTYVEQYQSTHKIDHIQMLVDGQLYDDMLIANQLESLASMPFADQVKTELEAIVQAKSNTKLHAQYKLQSSEFENYDFESVSVANHGHTLHEKLIEPFCQKLLNCSSKEVSAYYHRVPWVPLFYPETLLSYLKGQPQALPKTVFSYPTGEHVGDLALKLKSKILSHPNITVITEQPTKFRQLSHSQYELSFERHAPLEANQLAWSGTLGSLLQISDHEEHMQTYEKASFVLMFATVTNQVLKGEFSVLSVVDPAYVIYRVTNQTYCAQQSSDTQQLVIEINADVLTKRHIPEDRLEEVVNKELAQMGLIDEGNSINVIKTVTLRKALPLPNFANIRAFDQEQTLIQEMFEDLVLLGSASGFSSSSFNHQIIQGLKLAGQWSKNHESNQTNTRVNRNELSYQ